MNENLFSHSGVRIVQICTCSSYTALKPARVLMNYRPVDQNLLNTGELFITAPTSLIQQLICDR